MNVTITISWCLGHIAGYWDNTPKPIIIYVVNQKVKANREWNPD